MPPKRPVIKDDGTADFGALESVVSTQLHEDAKYDRENDAKFRAVHQKVATYDEFENIVLGAHLQPMKEDITNLDLKKTASSGATGRARERERERMMRAAAAECGAAAAAPPADVAPKSAQEFTRRWRALKGDLAARCRYLLVTGGARLAKFYRDGCDAVLGDALVALEAGFATADAAAVVEVLDALASTARFGLAVEFLSGPERKAGADVLSRAATAAAAAAVADAATSGSGGGGGGGDGGGDSTASEPVKDADGKADIAEAKAAAAAASDVKPAGGSASGGGSGGADESDAAAVDLVALEKLRARFSS